MARRLVLRKKPLKAMQVAMRTAKLQPSHVQTGITPVTEIAKTMIAMPTAWTTARMRLRVYE